MYTAISKFRQKWISHSHEAPPAEPVPFRQGIGPAVIYSTAFVLLATALLFAPVAAAGDRLPWAFSLALSLGLVLLCVGCFLEALRSLHPEKEHRSTHLCLLYVLVLVSLAIGDIWCLAVRGLLLHDGGDIASILVLSLPILLPHLIAPASLTLLLGPVFGTLSGIALSQLFSLQMCLNLYSAQGTLGATDVLFLGVVGLVAGLVAAAVVPRCIHCGGVRRNMHIVRIAVIALAAPLAGLAIGGLLMGTLQRDVQCWPAGWAQAVFVLGILALSVISCFAQTFFVAISLRIFEHVFALTSNITLQNYADLQAPLMDRLSQEAPGTLSHCMSVAAIAARAADSIGANAILARVGAYYHDIGKLTKPSFFTENQSDEGNPHDKLPAAASAVWIRNHVKDGLAFAKEFNLPIPIRKLIAEHHGTTLMAFFYHKAKQEAREAAEAAGDGRAPAPVDEGLFRYAGPKPSSKESGILLLADSVEAASRSLSKPTPQAIEALVADIFQKKLEDGQFDECPLSMAELVKVRKSITSSLLASLHARVAYPKDAAAPRDAGGAAPAPEPPATAGGAHAPERS